MVSRSGKRELAGAGTWNGSQDWDSQTLRGRGGFAIVRFRKNQGRGAKIGQVELELRSAVSRVQWRTAGHGRYGEKPASHLRTVRNGYGYAIFRQDTSRT